MKKITYYTYEEAKAIIEADKRLTAGIEKLRPEYEDENSRMDYGLDFCDFFEDWDADEEPTPICIYWETVSDEHCISVNTLEQALVIVRDIEEARGRILP